MGFAIRKVMAKNPSSQANDPEAQKAVETHNVGK
jgi:hypothetical protein